MVPIVSGEARVVARTKAAGRAVSRTARLILLVVAWLLVYAGCGSDDGPAGPPAAPAVTSVTPSPARQGDQVTIAGDHFGTTASQVGVTFSGTAGAVVSVTNTSIVASVPQIAPGNAAVVVTVGGRSSASVTLVVLQALPTVTGVNPTSVRAGAALTITGQNFLALERVRLAGAAPVILFDDDELTPTSMTATQIVVEIPLATAPGIHELRIRRGEDVSAAASSISVEIFTVTGTYALEGTVVFNDCVPADPPVGTNLVSIVTVTDSRPALAMTLRNPDVEEGVPHSGTLRPDGTFEVSIAAGEVSSTVTGQFELGDGGVPEIIGTDNFEDPTCRVQIDFTATRTSTSTSARVTAQRPALGSAHVLAGMMWGKRSSR